MNNPTFSGLPTQTQSALAGLSSAIAGVVPIDVRTWQVDVSILPLTKNELPWLKDVSEWAGKNEACLYYFECCSTSIDLAKVREAYNKVRDATDRAYSRLNDSENGTCKCLYVGSSQSVANRLKEHLGYGAKQTYALQLIYWARGLSLHLEFVCAKYPKDTPSDVIQALENTLSKIKNPIFGRRGASPSVK